MSTNGKPAPMPKLTCPHCGAPQDGFIFNLSVQPGLGIFGQFGCVSCKAWINTAIIQLMMEIPDITQLPAKDKPHIVP